MPGASLCPAQAYALCPWIPHLSENRYISNPLFIRIIHLSDLPLCSLRSLRLKYSNSQLPMKLTKCAIALGSNLGDSLATLKSAIATLNNTPGIAVKSHSSWYQTAPVGPPQPDYINACAILEVTLQPQELLFTLLEVEIKFNRIRREKWGPRTLDLDLLLYDDLILDTPTLTLPHPRMTQRAFVLVPLAEIAPDWVHPLTKSAIAQILKTADCSGVQKMKV